MGIERCGLSGGWRAGGKPCDFCKVAAVLFCRSDSAFLCLRCDTKIHGSNKLASRHERVRMCEVCEEAPAAVTCKADAASLCVACDADIHSANRLAHRHERVPVVPFFDSAESNIKSTAFNFLVPDQNGISEDGETAPWPPKIMEGPDLNFCEMDPFLAFESGCGIDTRFQQHHGTESVVPVQAKPTPAPVINHSIQNCLDMNICRSNFTSFGYPTQTLSQSVSSSSLDARVVPDGNSMSDISNGLGKYITSAPNQESQVSGMDREARVLRYREKRKNRKFEKTIRYASRKAYAESRPRIKGRFAKRTEIEAEVDECISSVPHLCPPQYFSAIWHNLTS